MFLLLGASWTCPSGRFQLLVVQTVLAVVTSPSVSDFTYLFPHVFVPKFPFPLFFLLLWYMCVHMCEFMCIQMCMYLYASVHVLRPGTVNGTCSGQKTNLFVVTQIHTTFFFLFFPQLFEKYLSLLKKSWSGPGQPQESAVTASLVLELQGCTATPLFFIFSVGSGDWTQSVYWYSMHCTSELSPKQPCHASYRTPGNWSRPTITHMNSSYCTSLQMPNFQVRGYSEGLGVRTLAFPLGDTI